MERQKLALSSEPCFKKCLGLRILRTQGAEAEAAALQAGHPWLRPVAEDPLQAEASLRCGRRLSGALRRSEYKGFLARCS